MGADELNTCSAHGPTRIRTAPDAKEQSNIPLTRSILYLYEAHWEVEVGVSLDVLARSPASRLEAVSNSGPDPDESLRGSLHRALGGVTRRLPEGPWDPTKIPRIQNLLSSSVPNSGWWCRVVPGRGLNGPNP